jgi:AcrR family transcriptional regulator
MMAGTLVTPPRRPRTSGNRGRYAKSGETRERILAAALKVAGSSGFHGASVAAIADEAGVAIGNLSYHFGSRDELLYELMRWLVGELLGEVKAAIAKHEEFFAKDEAALRVYLAHVRRNSAYVRLAEEVRLHHPKLYDETNAMWLAMFRDAILQGVRRGELRAMRDGEIDVLAHLLLGTRYFLDQMIHGAPRGHAPSDDVVVATYTKLMRDGIRSLLAASGKPANNERGLR